MKKRIKSYWLYILINTVCILLLPVILPKTTMGGFALMTLISLIVMVNSLLSSYRSKIFCPIYSTITGLCFFLTAYLSLNNIAKYYSIVIFILALLFNFFGYKYAKDEEKEELKKQQKAKKIKRTKKTKKSKKN